MDQNYTPGNTPENTPGGTPSGAEKWTAPKKPDDKKRNHMPIVAGAVGGLAVALIVALLFVSGVVGASPAKKYEKLQKQWLDEMLEKHTSGGKGQTSAVQSDQAVENLAKSYMIRLSLTDDCKSLLGMDILDELKLSGDLSYDRISQNAHLTTDFSLNGTILFQLDTIADLAYQIVFANIPQLSEEYLSMDVMDYMEEMGYSVADQVTPDGFDSMFGGNGYQAAAMSPELMENLLIGLKDIWVKHAPEQVILQKNYQQEIDGIQAKVDLYEASWTELELTDCMLEMMKWLQSQKEFEDYILKSTGMELADYRSGMSDLIAQLEADKEALTLEDSQDILLTVRLGAQKDVVSFELLLPESEEFRIQAIWTEEKGNKSKGCFLLKADGEENQISLHYDAEPDGDGRKGVVTMEFTDEGKTVSAELVYDGYRTEADGSFHCHAILNSEAFGGMGIGAEVDTTPEKQSLKLELLMGNLSMGELELILSETEYQAFEIPNQSYEVTDEEQLTEYWQTCDMDGFLSGILENQTVDALIQMIFGADMNGSMMKEALLDQMKEVIGEVGDEKEDGFDPAWFGEDEPKASGDFSGFEGYQADEDGWVSFEPVREEIMAAGKASTAYTVFANAVYDDTMKQNLAALAKEAYGSQTIEEEPYEYNQIYGYEPYVASYYTRMVGWCNEQDEYSIYLTLALDSVTGEVQGMEVSDTDVDRGCSLMAKALAVVSGMDAAEIESALKGADEEEDYMTIGAISIFWYDREEDSVSIGAYPVD